MKLAALLTALAALALSGHHHRPTACTVFANAVTSATNPVTGTPQVSVGGQVSCRVTVPQDLRVCPQLLVNGRWRFIRSADGYGTCTDTGWQSNPLSGYSMTFDYNYPYPVRAWVGAWWWYYGHKYSASLTSQPFGGSNGS